MVRIFCKNTGTFKEFPEGTTLQDIAPQFEFDKPYDILAAKVNNVAEGLRFRVFHNRDVEFWTTVPTSDATSTAGRCAFSSTRPQGICSRKAG